MIKEIVRNNIRCKVGAVFTWILVYADYIILLSPSKQGLQFIIDTCSRYAERHNLVYSSHDNSNNSKSKCLFFGKAVSNSRLVCMLLNGKQLPWVNNAKFIEIILNTNHDNQDIVVKRGIAIAKINSVLQ